jgi:hypothetical protein
MLEKQMQASPAKKFPVIELYSVHRQKMVLGTFHYYALSISGGKVSYSRVLH